MARRPFDTYRGSQTHASVSSPHHRNMLTQRSHRPSGWWWKVPLVTLLLLLGAGAAGVFWFDRAYADRVYPHVSLQGVPVGGKTRADAQGAVEAAFATFAQQPVTLRADDYTWQPTLADLGVTLDARASVDQAAAWGHGGELFAALAAFARGEQAVNVPLQVVVDGAKLDAYLRTVAATVDVKPQEATVVIENDEVRTTPSHNGRMVLIPETADALVKGLRQLQPQTVVLQMHDVVPQVADAQAADAQRTVEMLLSAPLEMVVDKQPFTLDQHTLGTLVRVERVEGNGHVVLEPRLDTAKLETVLHDITAKIGHAPEEPRLDWNHGDLKIMKDGVPGYGVDVERSVAAVNAALLANNRHVELPLGEVQPSVRADTLGSLGIKELISEGKSYFINSDWARMTNIKAGAKLVRGVLVAPGAEFSFNNTVGVDLDVSKGFVQGQAIVNNKVVAEDGGGICQDSTTMYRAAFYAGLPITARTAHASRLGFYEVGETVGMDAAIFTGTGPDLRFRNDTKQWLLIDTVVNDEEQSVAFRIYGTKVPGRTVERSEPSIEYRGGGVQVVNVTRTIKQDGNVVDTETFVSNFQPLKPQTAAH